MNNSTNTNVVVVNKFGGHSAGTILGIGVWGKAGRRGLMIDGRAKRKREKRSTDA